MKAKLALTTLICVAMSGCATVDLANVGKSASVVDASSSNQDNKVNVVQRAASKLYAAFTTQGWVANKSRKRVQSTASILLRGLDTDSDEGALSAYSASSVSLTQIHADIDTAKGFVSQTTKAAEVYLEMASDDTNLREELSSLQQALISAREAELVFKAALDKAGVDSDINWTEYSKSVDSLRDVTDAFGDRVRSGRTLTSALQSEVN